MQVYMNTDQIWDTHIVEIMKLKESGTYEEMKDFIRPCLIEGDIYKETKEEFLAELQQLFSKEDAEEIAKQDHPDIPFMNWNGFHVIFILDWTEKYWSMDCWDYVTIDMMKRWELTPADFYRTAIENMKKVPAKYRVLLQEEKPEFYYQEEQILVVEADIYARPPYTASIMLVPSYMKQFEKKLGEFYIMPIAANRLFLVAAKTLTDPFLQLSEMREKIQSDMPNMLSNWIFRYKEGMITELHQE